LRLLLIGLAPIEPSGVRVESVQKSISRIASEIS
jgi:hypothetical protein